MLNEKSKKYTVINIRKGIKNELFKRNPGVNQKSSCRAS